MPGVTRSVRAKRLNPRSLHSSYLASGLTLLVAIIGPERASALTLEEARERCRETVGTPMVKSCMPSKGYVGGSGGGQGAGMDKEREACRARAKPQVKACVERALTAAHGRPNTAVAVPAEKGIGAAGAAALPADFVPPPRSISDITAILDSERPDPRQIEKWAAEANVRPPVGGSPSDLARFYYARGNARAQLGQLNAALADATKAIEVGRGAVDANLLGRLQQFAGIQYSAAGNPKQALAMFLEQVRDTNVKGAKGFQFGGNRHIAGFLIHMGNLPQAEAYLRRSQALIEEARTSGLPGWRASYPVAGQSWEADVEFHRAIIFEARGQFREAEASYLLAERRRRASIKGILSRPNPPPAAQVLHGADMLVVHQARMKAKQGRLAEAESDARRALLSQLKSQGKYSPATTGFIRPFADILVEQGRYGEAEKLVRVALEVNRVVGVPDDSQSTAQGLSQLGSILNLQRRFEEAAAVYATLDTAVANWDPQRRQLLELNGSRIYSLYAAGKIDAGIAAAQALLKRDIANVGEKHFMTASSRGILAVGYARAGRDADAVREFREAIPVLLAAVRENADDDEATLVAARSRRLQDIVEAYIDLLARTRKDADENVIAETFGLAEAIRVRSVQQALAAASARSVVGNPELAELARQAQDLEKQVNARLGVLNSVLALPPDQRDDQTVSALRAEIDRLRAARDTAKRNINGRFPEYASLIEPRLPSIGDVRAVLKPNEAFLSFYFGGQASFVWAVPKVGPVAFVVVPLTAGAMETRVMALRQALEPRAEKIADIPAFDLASAYELYELILRPVEQAWRPAKSLVVATNGALGYFPLALLPTAPAAAEAAAGAPPFAAYRRVPWLGRSHAVSYVPSASALRTLRQLPPGSRKRKKLIGFGDPYFSADQANLAEHPAEDAPTEVAALAERGLTLRRRSVVETSDEDRAVLSLLPRLPDTADELKLIARALEVDAGEALNLGKAANERKVKDVDLSQYGIVAFATHGLKPGDLDGLNQPALALTAPDVADVDGDGLLTMEEVLALKLDADWVVLSACNTGSGAGVGSEAVSGLGRAFFYAGTRTLLVTNWSVHSESARALVADLFRRQAQDGSLTRAEALQAAMMALMDSPGYRAPDGEVLFTYAHPLFWAPYSIIGDGSGQGF